MIKAPFKLQDLRRRLYVKAKAEPTWRFWGLYVHVCKRETLWEAYQLAKENDGAPGVDGVTFQAIEAEGLEGFLERLREELEQRRYRPRRLRKVGIPKEGGKVRQLSIPCIRDRVVQGALKLILEPIFEADFQPGSFGYRPKKSAHAAIQRVSEAIVRHMTYVVDLDLRSYFDTVRHSLVLEKVARRVNDAEVMWLLKLLLKASGKQGVPQGGVITPLLTQKVILTVWVVGSPVLGRTRRNRNAVTNGDGIVADQDVFNQQSHDFLAFNDTKRFRGAAQASKECCESFRQAQEYGTIIGLVSDRLQLSTECLLAMTQCRHTFTQLLKRQEFFLIGGEKSFDTFANMGQLPLQTLLTFCGWIGSTRYCQPTIKFLVYQSRFFQQADHLSPDDLIEEFLSDEAAVIANRSA